MRFRSVLFVRHYPATIPAHLISFTRERSKVRSLVRPPKTKQNQILTTAPPLICAPKTLGTAGAREKNAVLARSARPLSIRTALLLAGREGSNLAIIHCRTRTFPFRPACLIPSLIPKPPPPPLAPGRRTLNAHDETAPISDPDAARLGDLCAAGSGRQPPTTVAIYRVSLILDCLEGFPHVLSYLDAVIAKRKRIGASRRP